MRGDGAGLLGELLGPPAEMAPGPGDMGTKCLCQSVPPGLGAHPAGWRWPEARWLVSAGLGAALSLRDSAQRWWGWGLGRKSVSKGSLPVGHPCPQRDGLSLCPSEQQALPEKIQGFLATKTCQLLLGLVCLSSPDQEVAPF